MSSCSGCWLWFLHLLWFFVIFDRGYEATPPWVARVPHLVVGSILHQGGRCMLIPPPDTEEYLPGSLLPPCLALPAVTQFGEWLYLSWGSLSASINRHWCHSLHQMYMFLLMSTAASHYLRSSPIFSGCSSRCPWWKPYLPLNAAQVSLTGRLLGDHTTFILLWHHLHFTSHGGRLAWGGAGSPVPC